MIKLGLVYFPTHKTSPSTIFLSYPLTHLRLGPTPENAQNQVGTLKIFPGNPMLVGFIYLKGLLRNNNEIWDRVIFWPIFGPKTSFFLEKNCTIGFFPNFEFELHTVCALIYQKSVITFFHLSKKRTSKFRAILHFEKNSQIMYF